MEDAVNSDIEKILTQYRAVAVLGASPNTERHSYRMADFLKEHGYHIMPVTPKGGEILGETVYPDLAAIPETVDVVDIFRRSEEVIPVVEGAIAIGAKAIWMQEGIVNEEAAARAREAGLRVVMDRCMLKEVRHRLAQKEDT